MSACCCCCHFTAIFLVRSCSLESWTATDMSLVIHFFVLASLFVFIVFLLGLSLIHYCRIIASVIVRAKTRWYKFPHAQTCPSLCFPFNKAPQYIIENPPARIHVPRCPYTQLFCFCFLHFSLRDMRAKIQPPQTPSASTCPFLCIVCAILSHCIVENPPNTHTYHSVPIRTAHTHVCILGNFPVIVAGKSCVFDHAYPLHACFTCSPTPIHPYASMNTHKRPPATFTNHSYPPS